MFTLNETMNATVDTYGKFVSLIETSVPDTTMMSLALIIFIIIAYTALKVLKNTIIVALIAASFPVVSNLVFGTAIQITLELLLFYAVSGMSMYLLYEVLALLYRTSKIFFTFIGILTYPITVLVKIIAWITGTLMGSKKKETKEEKKDKGVEKKKEDKEKNNKKEKK